MRIEILNEAKDDLAEGYVFYEDQSQGLGSYFLDSLFAVIDCRRSPAWIRRRMKKNL